MAASYFDVTMRRSIIETEMIKLKRELECERKSRKKMELMNKRLFKELSLEIGKNKAMERVCEHLAKEMSNTMQSERIRKVRMEQLLRRRDERVQISSPRIENRNPNDEDNVLGKLSRLVFGERSLSLSSRINPSNTFSTSIRRVSLEAENPHIKRGIKGSVEFSRVVKAIESKSNSRHWDTKVECQKAQLKILLKQKSPIRSNRLIMG
ncbi:hypothetical protein ACFE04_015306 [Oxalis oulophora]